MAKTKYKTVIYEGWDRFDKKWVWNWAAYQKLGWFRHWTYVDTGTEDTKNLAELEALSAINRRARSDGSAVTNTYKGI